tara:strand:+ start:11085 stop:11780 length:696 start_codon:yes stop_codon:yes gene_type:complete
MCDVSSIICLNKELNKSSFFGYSDMLMMVYEYLNIKEKVNLIKCIYLIKNSLSEYHVKYIKNVNNILNILIYSSLNIYSTSIPSRIYIDSLSFANYNNILEIVYPTNLKILKMEEIPVEYKNFVKIVYELSIKQKEASKLVLIHPDNMINELADSRKRKAKAAALMYTYKVSVLPQHMTLCFINDENYRNVERKYFVSERFYLFEPDPQYDYNIEDLNLLTFNEAIKELLQ